MAANKLKFHYCSQCGRLLLNAHQTCTCGNTDK